MPPSVIVSEHHSNLPEQHEIEAAYLLSEHFNCTVKFLIPVDDFKRKTPDIMMLGKAWEMKSPTGTSRMTVGNQFKRASAQSSYLVFDARRLKFADEIIERRVRYEFSQRQTIKKVILIKRTTEIVEIN